MKSASMFFVVLTSSLMAWVNLAAVTQTSPERWEYKIVNTCNTPEESNLNKLGDQGWELVSVQGNENNTCFNYYLKRPKGAFFNPAPVPQPVPPKCTLTLAQSPAFRGLRLGMSTDELLALFPGSKEQFRVREALSKAESNYGETSLSFNYPEYPESKELFNNIASYSFTLFDGRVVRIVVVYKQAPEGRDPTWTGNIWAAKVAEALNLPQPDAWVPPYEVPEKKISCSDFEISASIYGPSIRLSNTAYVEQYKQRKEADIEKRRREFKP